MSSTSYLRTPMAHLSTPLDMTVEEILDRGGSVSNIPSVRSLSDMRETIQNKFLSHIRIRGEVSDRVLRELSKRRKERVEQEREKRERADREAEERKHKLKKVKKRDSEEERPLAVGAHGVARQDGVDVHKGKFYSNLSVHTHFMFIPLSHPNIFWTPWEPWEVCGRA
jgi:transcriptional adapter 3